MSNLTDQLAADAAAILNVNEFGTSVSYTPSGGSARTIPAIVTYNLPSVPGETASGLKTLTGDASVAIANTSTAALGTASIAVNRDTITMPSREGGTSRTWAIVEIISQDSAMFYVRCR